MGCEIYESWQRNFRKDSSLLINGWKWCGLVKSKKMKPRLFYLLSPVIQRVIWEPTHPNAHTFPLHATESTFCPLVKLYYFLGTPYQLRRRQTSWKPATMRWLVNWGSWFCSFLYPTNICWEHDCSTFVRMIFFFIHKIERSSAHNFTPQIWECVNLITIHCCIFSYMFMIC